MELKLVLIILSLVRQQLNTFYEKYRTYSEPQNLGTLVRALLVLVLIDTLILFLTRFPALSVK